MAVKDKSEPERLLDSELDELRSKYGEVLCVSTQLGDIALRPPTGPEFDRLMTMIMDEKKRSKAFEMAIRTCVVFPGVEVLDSWLKKKPGLAYTCGNSFLEFAGVESEAAIRK